MPGSAFTAYIPGEYISTLTCLASRADVDPLWSTEAVEIVHHGHETTRVQKIGRIASHDIVRRALRVCWQNEDGQFNCCRCSKCLRNMAALRAHGQLDRMQTFSQPLDLRTLAALDLGTQWPHLAESVREMQVLAEARGDVPLAQALRTCYDRSGRRGARALVSEFSILARRIVRQLLPARD